ncbi:MAG: acyltransferase [Chitinophagaceae bacterium]|nr:acyltransferase [Chitinophagaceae bacterium]
MRKPAASNIFFGNLDALRFLAFLSVFISHVLFLPEPTSQLEEVLQASLTLIFLGVPFFFTLSSFLITYRLLTESERKGRISLGSFYKNRILRIWPAYFLLLLICFAGIPLVTHFFPISGFSLPPLWPFLAFVVNFYIIKYGAGFSFALTILWSISIEEQFYFFWGWVMRFLQNWSGILTALLLLASIIFSWFWLYRWHFQPNNLAVHSVYVIQNFAAGIWLAFFAKKKSGLFQKLKSIHFSYFLLPYILLPLATVFVTEMITLNLIKSGCFALILFHQCFHERPVIRFGKWKLFNYLGKISYGLYIYHALVITAFNYFLHTETTTGIQRNFIYPVIMLLVTIIYSSISYELIEKRFLKLKARTLA